MQATQFKCNQGHVWTLDINIGHYLKFKTLFDIDLAETFSQENSWLAKLAAHENIEILLGMLDSLTEVERDKRAMSLDDMYLGLNGDVIAAATDSLVEAVVVFLPAHKQKALRIIVDSVRVGMARTVKHVEEQGKELM